MSYLALAPGARHTLAVDLASWSRLDPGTYAVTCRYSAEIVPSGSPPSWPTHGHEVWDLTLTAPLTISIR